MTARVVNRQRTARFIAFALLISMQLACSDEAALSGPSDGPSRYAKRFLPTSDAWIPESEVPRTPQAEPHMVIWELSEFEPGVAPTPAQQHAADELAERCRAVAHEKGWFNFQRGLEDGFRLLPGDRRHYYNEAFLFDDRELDCERPEFLMYYGTPKGKILTGMMFYVSEPTGRGEQIGGPLTLWHYHVWNQEMCMRDRMLILSQAQSRSCEEGIPSFRSPEMLHVWLLDHPEGRFATTMGLTRAQLDAALETRALEAAAAPQGEAKIETNR